ncbi:MAG TPA: hypothetical protein VFZ75_06440 [Actinomycetota bacterium]|nr:hypothetical protein [Actinomycetota bacterium]
MSVHTYRELEAAEHAPTWEASDRICNNRLAAGVRHSWFMIGLR